MPLAAGQALTFYEIIGPLGAGGMGEVYRARDTRLDRDVAIKVLPVELAGDEERLRRFDREAKTLAALNHPNVAGIHGVDQVEDVCFIAMELVPGEDLAARLARGALPVDEALDVCRQIAEGLEAAHEAGIVHRDLKPANVRLTPDGAVKVVDFGLAKTQRAEDGSTSENSALTTRDGIVLGTPTYMAPEQARGRRTDRRADVWALGCVLYECLAGRRVFEGESVTEVLGAVLEREPDWTALPQRTPRRVRELIESCLVKDPRQRLRDAGDARLELERALAERAWSAPATKGAAANGRRIRLAHLAALVVGVFLGAVLMRQTMTSRAPAARELRLAIDMKVPYQETYPRIAPHGRTVVHEGLVPDEAGELTVRALFRRDLDDFESHPLSGTENPLTFCFSPDGEYLAVLVERSGRSGELTLFRVPVHGDAPSVRLGAWPRQARRRGGIAWLESDVLVGTADPNLLIVFRLDDRSSNLLPIERAFASPGAGVDVFRSLGDGRHALGRSHYYGERGYLPAVVAVDIVTGEERVLAREAEHAALTGDGRILFTRGDTLFESPFDAERFEASGPSMPLADGLRTENAWRAGWFDLARDGTLIWLPGGRQGTRRYLSVVERSGELTPLWPERMAHDGNVIASNDGTFFTTLVVSDDGQRVELWGSEVEHPNLRRLLAEPGVDFVNGHPLPGGRGLIYRRISQEGTDGIFRVALDAAAEPQLLLPADRSEPELDPVALTPTGDLMIVSQSEEVGVLLSTSSITESGASTPDPLIDAALDYFWPKFSPDGRWLTYAAKEVERAELVMRAFRDGGVAGAKLPVRTLDGELPWDYTWSRDPLGGFELLVIGDDRRSVFSVPLEDEESGRFGEPRHHATIDDAYVLDCASLAGGRLLVLLQEPQEQEMNLIGVVIGALGDTR